MSNIYHATTIERTENKVNEINSNSTETQYPSAIAVYNYVNKVLTGDFTNSGPSTGEGDSNLSIEEENNFYVNYSNYYYATWLRNSSTKYSMYQVTENDDTKTEFKFKDLPLGYGLESAPTGIYNRVNTGGAFTTLSFGTSIATGKRSVAFGELNLNSGFATICAGTENYITGDNSIGVGYANRCVGNNCAVFGQRNIAYGNNSVAFGIGNVSLEDSSCVIGTYSSETNDSLFVVGNGTEQKHNNAFIVYKDGRIACTGAPKDKTDVVTKEYLDNQLQELLANINNYINK